MLINDFLKISEQNHFKHFAYLPRALGFQVTKMSDVWLINCGLGSSMFNIAYGAPGSWRHANPLNTPLATTITAVKAAFKGQPFAWWIPPSQHDPEITQALLEAELFREATEQAMICELTTLNLPAQKNQLHIQEVSDSLRLQDFIRVLGRYDQTVDTFYQKMNADHWQKDEKLFVGYREGKPVTIAILFISDLTAAIFSLITNPEAQGHGYGTEMMIHLLATAQKHGCLYVTLSASSAAGYRLYENLGFRTIGEFGCFEFKGLSPAAS